MNKIIGKVLVKETGVGVPNLLIVVFDIDPTSTSGLPAIGTAVVQGAIGNRIGSVLTDAGGSFELTFESDLFAPGDPERRPDLVLGAFAPEDSQGPDNPTPLPPQQRLLVFSNVPRRDAGRTEAYVLRVTRAQLDQFGIPYDQGRTTRASSVRLADSILDAWNARDAVRDQLRPRTKQEVIKIRETKERASSLFAKLSALPVAAQESVLFVRRDAPLEDLRKAQALAIEEGIKALRRQRRVMYRRITARDAQALGLGVADGRINGEVDIASIWPPNGEGQALVRARSLVDACRERDLLATAFDPQDREAPAAPVASAITAPDDMPAEEQLRGLILKQVREGESSSAPSVSTRLDLLKLQRELDTLQLKGGPADAVALHDFNSLQIAFKHIWTEAFDETLRAQAEALYLEAVQLADERGLDSPEIQAIDETSQLLSFIQEVRNNDQDLLPVPDEVVEAFPQVTESIWNSLGPDQRRQINWYANMFDFQLSPITEEQKRQQRSLANEILSNPTGTLSRVRKLLLEIGHRMSEPYAFHLFVPDSYNFGIMTTYRQRWEPLTYQAGDLVATIPLAPGETRKFNQRVIVRKSRSEREIDKSLSSRREESSQTSRADAEIVRKASTGTNFKQTAEGSFTIGIVSLEGTTEFGHNQMNESANVKKDFREAVARAAQDYSKERQTEVTTSSSEDIETTTSGELSNPNNELTVTYLLYELQRRYRISEHLYKLTPVILVAQRVPAPHEIDEAWLLAHEWILHRVLLDDGLKLALDYLKEFPGEELSVEIKRANWQKQMELVDELESALTEQINARDELRKSLVDTIQGKELAEAAEDSAQKNITEAVLTGGLSFLFGDDKDKKAELLEAQRKALQMSLGYVEETVKEIQQKLTRGIEALQQATEELTRGLEKQTNKRTTIDQLRVHVKENVLHYMQAIWAHEPHDQRFFRLYDLDIQWVTEPAGVANVEGALIGGNIGDYPLGSGIIIDMPLPMIPVTTRKLVEVADLDTLLGFKGNYLIFPLKEPCYLTRFMMQEYVDDYFGIHDPDPYGNYTTEELLEYIECAYHDQGATEDVRAILRDTLIERLTSPRRDAEEIVVPTGKLFIEALPGEHALLEDFKLLHRGMDVMKVRAEVREAELENLRRAARLIAGEREDPDIDKRVLVQGNAGVVVEPE
jgi:hypothetical protein